MRHFIHGASREQIPRGDKACHLKTLTSRPSLLTTRDLVVQYPHEVLSV